MKFNNRKKQYSKPGLSVFGDVKKITADGGGSLDDGDWGPSQ